VPFSSNVYSINVHLLAFIVLCYPHAFASDPFILYAFSIAISNYCLKYISNSHSHSHFQQNLKTKVSIISPTSPLFLRRHVAIPASPRNISCVATQETAALSKGISCLTSQLPGQADSNAGTTIAFRQKMLYLCIVNETH
ncbi:hypothetical protein ACTNCZ_12550, partial [Segatella copri]|uniref:hypothetical protein n=1 Tax=Segatella copri TaxID=165179 RepID=UPI003F896D82